MIWMIARQINTQTAILQPKMWLLVVTPYAQEAIKRRYEQCHQSVCCQWGKEGSRGKGMATGVADGCAASIKDAQFRRDFRKSTEAQMAFALPLLDETWIFRLLALTLLGLVGLASVRGSKRAWHYLTATVQLFLYGT
jgi:hypothetical protein